MRELLEKARPAIEAQRAPTPEQRKAGSDMRGFPTGTPYGEMIGSQAALFRLDHEWWPKNREAVLELIQAAEAIEMMLTGHVEVDSWPVTRVGPLMAAISHMRD